MEQYKEILNQIGNIDKQYAKFLQDYFNYIINYDSFEGRRYIENENKVEFIIKYEFIEIHIYCFVGDINIDFQFFDGKEYSIKQTILISQLPDIINFVLKTYKISKFID